MEQLRARHRPDASLQDTRAAGETRVHARRRFGENRGSAPPGGPSSFASSTMELRASDPPTHGRYRHPPGGTSHIDLSTLEPLDEPCSPPRKSWAADRYEAEVMSGISAAHVTGSERAASPHAPRAEFSDAAGNTAFVTARRQSEGVMRHFFAEPAWPSPTNERSPFHRRPQSEYGRRMQTGHFESGQPTLAAQADLTPRATRAAGKLATSPPHVPPSHAHAPLTPGRTRPSAAHRREFGGEGVGSLFAGD